MRILKTHVLLRLFNSYIVDTPQPANISYLWNFGSLLALCLGIQILTGAFLAMHYQPNIDLAFNSVEHIMRDVNNGWIIRYTHANVATFFFIFVYAHIARGLYYGSYKSPRVLVWSIGVIILILMICIGFLGYEHSPKWFNNISEHFNDFYLNLMPSYCLCSAFTITTPCSLKTTQTLSSDDSSIKSKQKNSDQLIETFLKEKNLTPVYVYDNLDLPATRKKISEDLKQKSGIYLILNKITLDYYIGSASTNRMYSRFSNHLIYFSGSKIVKLAVKKYNLSNFAFLVLEIFPEIVNQQNNKNLLDLEDFYLKSLLPNYNILTEAGNSFGYKHTEITRIKMKANYSLERRLQIGNLNKGNSLPIATVEKFKQIATNRKLVYSEQGKLNLKLKSKPLLVFNLNGTLYGEFPSLTEAAKSLNCGLKTIYRCLKTESKVLKRQLRISLKN